MKHWVIWAVVLAVIGVGFTTAGLTIRGYLYIAAVFFLIAVSLCIHFLAPPTVRKIYFVLIFIGLIYFFAVELLILSSNKTTEGSSKSYIVVLGAGVQGDKPSLSLLHRLQAAETYLKKNPNSKAVLSGGQGADEDISEAECMRRYLVDEKGFPEYRFIIEDKSTTTIENLKFSKEKILEDDGEMDDVAILSSPYHLYRAKAMARRLGYIKPDGVACVHGYPIFSIGMYIREAVGITHLWIFGE